MQINLPIKDIVGAFAVPDLFKYHAGNPEKLIKRVASPESGSRDDLVFVWTKESLAYAREKPPAALVVSESLLPELNLTGEVCVYVAKSAELAMAHVCEAYAKRRHAVGDWPRIHPTAVVHPSVQVPESAFIGPYSVIYQNVILGEHVVIESHVVIEPEVSIGPGTIIMHHCSIGAETKIGARVMLQPGVVIGSDGFGFVQDGAKHKALPHLGNVVIEDDVQIGAHSCIDRAKIDATRIGRGTKMDNLCHVGHNVQIGEDCVLTAGFCAGGSSRVGNRVKAGGYTGLYPHVEVPDDCGFGFRAGVTKSIKEKGIYAGIPTMPLQAFLRSMTALKQLPELKKEIKNIADRLRRLETH